MTTEVITTAISQIEVEWVSGSYINGSDRPRRSLLMQMGSSLDRPTAQVYFSPGQGTMLRDIHPTGVVR